MAELGLDVRILHHEALFKLELTSPVAGQGAVYDPGDAQLELYELVLASAAFLRAKGAMIREYTEVSKLVVIVPIPWRAVSHRLR